MELFIRLCTSRQQRYLSYYISLSKADLCKIRGVFSSITDSVFSYSSTGKSNAHLLNHNCYSTMCFVQHFMYKWHFHVRTFGGGYNEINAHALCSASHSDKKNEREHTQRQDVKLFLGPTLQGDVRRRVKQLASNHMRTLITSLKEVDAIYQDFVQECNCHAPKSPNCAALQIV